MFQALSTLPLYRSNAKLLINDNQAVSSVVPFKDPLDGGGRRYGSGLNTHVKVLRSPALAAEVIHELDLASHPEYIAKKEPFQDNVKKLSRATAARLSALLSSVQTRFLQGETPSAEAETSTLNQWVQGLQRWLQSLQEVDSQPRANLAISEAAMGLPKPGGAALSAPNVQELSRPRSSVQPPTQDSKPTNAALIAWLQGRLSIRPDPAADIINISFRAHDPSLTATVANTLAHKFIKFSRDMRFNAANDALDWLKKQAAETQQKVEDSERVLETYKKEHDVYSIEDRISGLTLQLTALNTKLVEAETERVRLETLHRKLEDTHDSAQVAALLPELHESERMREVQDAYEQLEVQIKQLRKRYGPGHPKVAQLRADLNLQQQGIDDEVERAIGASEARYELVKADEASLRAQFDKLKDEVRGLNEIAIRYRTLERDAESNRRLGDMMLSRLKEASLIPALKEGNTARVIGLARVPRAPINYRPVKNIITAGLAGLVIAIGLAAGLGYVDNTLETPQEAEDYLGLSVIGLIGKYKPPRKSDPTIDETLFVLHSARSQMAEAFKSLRTNMLFSYTDSPRKVFMVTSSTPNEGKTTISANLAVVMAQLEHRVLLIEADLRNPSLAQVFNIQGQTGLSKLLLQDGYDTAAALFDGNLSVVPAGEPPPNPAELLGSRRMQRYLEHVKELYDIIIIDTPPVLAVSDALALNPIVDGTLLVLRANSTTFEQVQRSIGLITSIKSDLMSSADREVGQLEEKSSLGIGIVMNFLDISYGQSYGYYGYYGNYYHD